MKSPSMFGFHSEKIHISSSILSSKVDVIMSLEVDFLRVTYSFMWKLPKYILSTHSYLSILVQILLC